MASVFVLAGRVGGSLPRRLVLAALGSILAAGIAAGAVEPPAGDPGAPRDSITGLWLGTIGSEREKIEVGLDLRRTAEGALEIFLTQPISNYFGVKAGAAKSDGDKIVLDELALSLRLHDGVLEGTYPGPNSPALFRRAELLPVAAGIPDVPTGPAPAWQTRLNGQIFASPAVFDGKVYLGTTGGVFSAVNSRDGKLLWSFAAGRPIFGTALVTTDAVFFTCDNGYLFRLRRDDGKEVWRYDLGDERVSRVLGHPEVFDWDWHGPKPEITDGVIYVGAGDGGFHAVDAATGARRWRFEAGGRIRGGAAVAGNRVVFGSADHFVYALDTATGKQVWKHDTGAEIEDQPLIAGTRVYLGNRGGGLYALDLSSGERLWKLYFWGSWLESTPVLADGILYVGSSDLRRVSAIRPDHGHVIWRTDVYGWSFGTPLLVGDKIFVGAAGGEPYFIHHVASFSMLDRATGKLLRRFPLPEVPGAHQWGIAGSPALAGDLVVVSTIQGGVMAFPVK
ncbi:MAG TPA: PQQ-binding-like beta-propeller repeat protein [Thermoanaerobaculia bacterium]|nr:PQQ-binding-like beta-propeller repeat protein [Thermoanaerobaculia bacterium]